MRSSKSFSRSRKLTEATFLDVGLRGEAPGGLQLTVAMEGRGLSRVKEDGDGGNWRQKKQRTTTREAEVRINLYHLALSSIEHQIRSTCVACGWIYSPF